jgi:toxin FitB
MIVLDTNVISELVKRSSVGEARVFAWATSLPLGMLATTAVSFAECLSGFRANAGGPDIVRKQRIFEQIMDKLCEGRIYPFDAAAAREYAEVMRERRAIGRSMARLDAQIAAIARANKAVIASRDVDFRLSGVDVINPWDYAGS